MHVILIFYNMFSSCNIDQTSSVTPAEYWDRAHAHDEQTKYKMIVG